MVNGHLAAALFRYILLPLLDKRWTELSVMETRARRGEIEVTDLTTGICSCAQSNAAPKGDNAESDDDSDDCDDSDDDGDNFESARDVCGRCGKPLEEPDIQETTGSGADLAESYLDRAQEGVMSYLTGFVMKSATQAAKTGKGSDQAEVYSLLCRLNTSVATQLPRSLFKAQNGERKYRPHRSVTNFFRKIDVALDKLFSTRHLLQYGEELWEYMMVQLTGETWILREWTSVVQVVEHPLPTKSSPKTVKAALVGMLTCFCKNKFKRTLGHWGITAAEKRSFSLREGSKAKGGTKSRPITYMPHKTDTGLQYTVHFENASSHGATCVLEFELTTMDGHSVVLVSPIRGKLPNYLHGGLESVPLQDQKVKRGDKLVAVNGHELTGVVSESELKLWLNDHSFPRTYTLHRQLFRSLRSIARTQGKRQYTASTKLSTSIGKPKTGRQENDDSDDDRESVTPAATARSTRRRHE